MDKDYGVLAKKLYESGNNCSNSIFKVFVEELNLEGSAPQPRSIDGLCGCVLITKYILSQINKSEYIEDYVQKFIEKFKYNKCVDLIRYQRRCNDYVAFSANYIQSILEQ